MFGLRSLSTPVHRLSREERAVEEKFQAKLARSGDLNAFLRSLDEGCALRWRSSTLATAWHRLAKHGGRSQRAREAVRTLAARSQRLTARAAPPREIANIVWAWGKLRFRDEALLSTLCEGIGDLRWLNAFDLSNIVYSLGLLNFRHAGFLREVCAHVPSRMAEFSAQGLSNTVYSLAQLHFHHAPFLQAICAHLHSRLGEFHPQGISNTVYALGQFNHRDTGLCLAICIHAAPRLHSFNGQSVTNTLDGFARVGYQSTAFLLTVCRHVPQRVGNLNAGDIASIAYEVARACDHSLDLRKSRCPSRHSTPSTTVVGEISSILPG